MTLTDDARRLLRLIADAPEPVAASSFFDRLNPPPPGLDENHPEHEAWTERQMALYGATVTLWQRELVRVVHPANGRRPDLLEVTDTGRATLKD